MKSDLAAWIDEVGTDTERAVMALHDSTQPPVDGHCPTCVEHLVAGDFASLDLVPRQSAAAFPCPTARLIAWAHRDQPGFRLGWAPKTGVGA